MTAVDQVGSKAVRYRLIRRRSWTGEAVEITVHPAWTLTDELALALAISAPWLSEYFLIESRGG